MTADPELSYHTVNSEKWTFQAEGIRSWVEERLDGRVLNACAGKTKLAHDRKIVRNDIDERRDTDMHVDVCEIADHLQDESFETVVYDPPFSHNQSMRTYDGQTIGEATLAKRQFDQLLKPGGRIIQFGYSTSCMPGESDYERVEVAVFNTIGRMNDILAVVEEKDGQLEHTSKWF